MSTVVPIGGNVTSALLLGWAWAVCLADEPEDFGLALAVELAEDDEVDVDGPEAEADDEAVLWTCGRRAGGRARTGRPPAPG